MLEKDLRVFIGPVEIANVGAILGCALRERGVKVTVVADRSSPFQDGRQYDMVLRFQESSKLRRAGRRLYHFSRFFCKHNAFVFLFGRSLLPHNLDLPILKLFRKKTVMWFVGSDIRHYEALARAAERAGIRYYSGKGRRTELEALRRKLRMISMVEKYVDHVISGPSFSQLLAREYHRVYVPIDVANIRYRNVPESTPVVVHAPSNPETKGTSYVLQAVEQLKSEGYGFDFHLFRNTSNAEVREALSDADIAVDQLFGLAPGMFALEAMAAGCAVLGSSHPSFSGFPSELPVIHTDPDNVHQNLRMLLENPELRKDLGERGRKYVEKYHDSRKIADDFITLLTTGEADMTYDPRERRATD